MTGEIISEVEKLPISRRDSDGVLIIPLEEYGIDTPMLLQRSDGATLYATRELASLLFRIRNFNPDLLVYVVGGEQKLHFMQAFKALELMGHSQLKCMHVDFGLVSLKEGKMSTREGRVIFFDDVLQEAIVRAQAILQEKRPDLTQEERDNIAEVVGIGAIKFNDLSQSRIKNIVFDWDKMLSFDGDTAPYLQYSYARVKSILRKAEVKPEYIPELLKEKEEADLLKALSRFPEIIKDAASNFAPHTIAQYLLDIARVFTAFYQAVPVLKAENENITKARLGLIEAYATVIKKGLSLLGIDVLERM
jgi:arginyl-tRNA synthetase